MPTMIVSLSVAKDLAQIFWYLVGICALVAGVCQYRRSVRLEQMKWAAQLHEKFFEASTYKKVREIIDCDPPSKKVDRLVRSENSELTDYLNFFELIAVLQEKKQVGKAAVWDLFEDYLDCLKKHPSLLQYINTPSRGFQHLRRLLAESK